MNTPSRVLLALAIALCGALPARAIGLGFYASGSGMSSKISYSGSSSGGMDGPSSSSYQATQGSGFVGFGLMLDTAAARDRLFGARVQMGADLFNSASPDRARLYRFYGTGTFGFGVVRTKTVRFWLGPQIGMAVHSRSIRYTSTDLYTWGPTLTALVPRTHAGNPVMFGISAGAVLGVNIHVAEAVSLSLEAGFRYNLAFRLTAYEGYGTVGILFRVNDSFNRPLEPLARVRGSLPDSTGSYIRNRGDI